MTAQLLQFPKAATPAAPSWQRPKGALATPRRRYTFAEMVKLFQLVGTPRTQVDYLRDMHTQQRLPLPVNPRRWKGVLQQGAATICRKSVWCAVAVDSWLDGAPGAPTSGAGLPLPTPAPVRNQMRATAARLAGQGGR